MISLVMRRLVEVVRRKAHITEMPEIPEMEVIGNIISKVVTWTIFSEIFLVICFMERIVEDLESVDLAVENFPAEVEADAGGLLVRPPVAAGVALLEHARQILRRDADARVLDAQRLALGIDAYPAALARVFQGVCQQLLYRKAQPLLVRQHGQPRLLVVKAYPAADELLCVFLAGCCVCEELLTGASVTASDKSLTTYLESVLSISSFSLAASSLSPLFNWRPMLTPAFFNPLEVFEMFFSIVDR